VASCRPATQQEAIPRVGEQKRVAILPARTQANKSTDRKPKRAEYS
jgi:hypothetical protein